MKAVVASLAFGSELTHVKHVEVGESSTSTARLTKDELDSIMTTGSLDRKQAISEPITSARVSVSFEAVLRKDKEQENAK